MRAGFGGALMTLAMLAAGAPAGAQTVDVAPFVGYRFGGEFFETVTGQEVDLDGAPTLGVVVNVPFRDDLLVEALFTHQKADVVVPSSSGVPTLFPVSVDHWMGGGLREMGRGPARPFLTGLLGITRYGVPGDNEIRFTVAAGGGIRLFPTRHLGVRLEGRLFATFADIEGRAIACAPGAGFCLFALDTDVLWQAEFKSGLVASF
ncbi:MAG TPA: hypothetical protein VD833_03560 [Vicinamibacterales bacterium]|nr:hypothetical protein [Vicinamibacterales bacterium]